MNYLTISLAALSATASAVPTLQTRGEGTSFNLRVGPTPDAPDAVAALRSNIWSVGSENSQAKLFTDRSKGALFYEYGPEASSSVGFASNGFMIKPGGTATVPAVRAIELEVNNGTAGVEIVKDTNLIPKLAFDNGRFQACAESAGQTDGFILIYVQEGQRNLADCAAVDLISVCSGTGVGAPLLGQLGKPHVVDCQSN
ncbi:unnamed protein product [Periconia digitata]|uniref:DUF7907 domain-containing protein n=1 Tax=Periconia digitata TaxID=1303443 RepID=A0A9W4UEV5_9PLEO|nr:unnamed protein product [Periconia digitata]